MTKEIITPIFQFGTSRFLQAHAALFVHEALPADDAVGPITVVAISGSVSGRARLQALARDEGYPVVVRGLERGERVEHEIAVKSIRRALDAEGDWPLLAKLFAEQAEFVVSNTTEAGLTIPSDLVVDLTHARGPAPAGYPAKLLVLLAHRFAVSAKLVVMLPTELVPRNGDTLKDALIALARRSGASDALLSFIADDCVFANSLVDRIVSSAIEPAGAIAEPYALWAIEKQARLRLPCRHPAIALVEDLEHIERLKLHILNLGHTVLAQCWMTDGLRPDLTVGEILQLDRYRNLLTEVYGSEVIPGFKARGLEQEATAYVGTTIERFDNPFLDHRLSDIAAGHPTKVQRRIGGFLQWVPEERRRQSPSLEGVLAAVH
ncbi:mannitol dehydrogenase family protein [Mesorhizobium sp. BH1-1-5]|uniref:mannitol dehydrogenase family protein n=1 Tax=Mesorhizobium sp. BH1-1-5 TaxID=2876661 RepID=UPI001CCEB291|nr:mannitol dehydrogenase family protein [Mesorhizobium sp. BH1-1-5]MBZ9989549.1 mannitol dehydrogenase family protein [Mesorhizobium sp. BH1-1-5]